MTVKEIGIRKTRGASSIDIVRLLVGQFLRPVLIANVFAWPLAFFAMRIWPAGFDDRIALSPLYFGAASLLAVTIAVLTVLTQSLRALRAAPAGRCAMIRAALLPWNKHSAAAGSSQPSDGPS